MTPTSRSRGFTLVELLVVIAIIAMLISLLIPVLSKTRNEAKWVLCKSNLRQVGMTLMIYETDFRAFPQLDPAAGGMGAVPERVSATGADLDAYISGRKMWYCPDRDGFVQGTIYKFEVADWPLSGYFNWSASMFPQGLRTRYPTAYSFDDSFGTRRYWYEAYYPLAQDIMRGYPVDPVNGYLDDSLRRIAHQDENGRLKRSNAVRHDGSLSSQKYFCAVRADGTLDPYTFPGSICYGSNSSCYHVVPPEPFAGFSSILPETFMP